MAAAPRPRPGRPYRSPALQFVFEHFRRGIGQPAVNISRIRKPEPCRRMGAVFEHKGCTGIDGNRSGPGCGIWQLLPRVELERFKNEAIYLTFLFHPFCTDGEPSVQPMFSASVLKVCRRSFNSSNFQKTFGFHSTVPVSAMKLRSNFQKTFGPRKSSAFVHSDNYDAASIGTILHQLPPLILSFPMGLV